MASIAEAAPGALVAQVERALAEAESLPDAGSREKVAEVVQALLDLYGLGLERVVELVAERDDGELAAALAADELVSHLLLLHGLHPVPLEERVLQALGEVRPYLESHGGDVELLEVGDSSVRLRLQGSCRGCPSSAMTLKLAIENAIRKTAPEIEEVLAEEPASPSAGLLQIELSPPAAPEPTPADEVAGEDGSAEWAMAGGLPELSGGGSVLRKVAGRPILFLRVGGGTYAYRPECPGCAAGLGDARLEGVALACAGCGRRYDVIRAGRCLDAPELYLEPVPLLVGEDGLVKVALAVPA